jgi:hypothetical protein
MLSGADPSSIAVGDYNGKNPAHLALQLLGKVSTDAKSKDDIALCASRLLNDEESSAQDDSCDDVVDFRRREVAIVPANRLSSSSDLSQSVEFATRVVDLLVNACPTALKERLHRISLNHRFY